MVFYRGGGAFSHGGVWCGGRYGVGGARVLYAAGVGVCAFVCRLLYVMRLFVRIGWLGDVTRCKPACVAFVVVW